MVIVDMISLEKHLRVTAMIDVVETLQSSAEVETDSLSMRKVKLQTNYIKD